MVGVPGKFKGCETCRLRRVKCDNTHPFCKKCIDSGRTCAGYGRETVFIVGTPEDGGRCSSHPPRVIKSKKGSSSSQRKGSMAGGTPSPKYSPASPSSSKQAESYHQTTSVGPPSAVSSEQHSLVLVQPLRPAWDDVITLRSGGLMYATSIAALNTNVHSLVRQTVMEGSGFGGSVVFSSFPQYIPADVRPTLHGNEFHLHSQCMVHLASPVGLDGSMNFDFSPTATANVCLLLYENNSSVTTSTLSIWHDLAMQLPSIQQQGPSQFTTFPAHHFFVRVFRPTAIFSALLNRTPTFLSDPEWVNRPWKMHPKAWLDQLLDIVAIIPDILGRTDHVIPYDPTMERRMMAQDLLGSCLDAERALHQWHNAVQRAGGPISWVENSGAMDSQMPFTDTLAFCDSPTALMFVTYWTALVLLYPCIESLHIAIFQPVLDAFPSVFPDLPPSLHIPDPAKYSAKEVREISSNVCRSLDFALVSTTQPDLLTVPLFIVEAFYRDINVVSGDATLELIWCDAFRSRLTSKGQDIANLVQGRQWVDVAQY